MVAAIAWCRNGPDREIADRTTPTWNLGHVGLSAVDVEDRLYSTCSCLASTTTIARFSTTQQLQPSSPTTTPVPYLALRPYPGGLTWYKMKKANRNRDPILATMSRESAEFGGQEMAKKEILCAFG